MSASISRQQSGLVTGQLPARGSIHFQPISEMLHPQGPAPGRARVGVLDEDGRLREGDTVRGALGVRLPVADGWVWRATPDLTDHAGQPLRLPIHPFNFALAGGDTVDLGITVRPLGYAVICGSGRLIKGPYDDRAEAQSAADELTARNDGAEYRVQELVTG